MSIFGRSWLRDAGASIAAAAGRRRETAAAGGRPETAAAGGRRERTPGEADFTATAHMLLMVAPALLVGVAATIAAAGLVALIALITSLAYTGRAATGLSTPQVTVLGPLSVLVPVAGGLVVGLMARFGSEGIRGHGIPEALEAILMRGSRMQRRLAVLKPLASAVAIGTGGPFGAEGPIVVTGGALGSILGQLLPSTAEERRILLVAGAAAGMTAVFATPLAAVLLALELMLFEWRPRSLVPVVLAVSVAQALREALAGAGLLRSAPVFGTLSAHPPGASPAILAVALLIGLAAGGLAWTISRCVYAVEDGFGRLPLHWMWWPALAGIVVGLGGLIEPHALGVGYGSIEAEMAGRLALGALLALLLVKLTIWAVALGSNTSGGILAPVMMMGAALGGLIGLALPAAGAGYGALIGMGASFGAATGCPLTGIVFAIEATRSLFALPALLLAGIVAHTVGVLTMRRSVLTEKLARRGVHVPREYEAAGALRPADGARPSAEAVPAAREAAGGRG